jgi:hypothetical protein
MKEHDLQNLILDYLSAKRIFHYRNNSGAMAKEYNGKKYFMRFGCPGSPDIVCVINGLYVGIECKGEKGKQSETQKEFQKNLEYSGGKYILAYSLDDVLVSLIN